ncbi:hypothetical protein [Massilibacteroides sp.]|uniref:hypothetical protein n=1 Tax=Massilibacteroides sp. TaxID=2034766 RepID=UPI00260D8E1F|nr:hypothetical protein [Massilibacteroides sp.]MDD4515439.1 hypothetical protein [Massilibacteroides sp.]
MSTLFDQSPRMWHTVYESDLKVYISELEKIAEKSKFTIDQVLKAAEILELKRKNNLYVNNGDAFDEQMAGFGELLKLFLSNFKEAYGVTSGDDDPRFLEAIAIALGYKER